MRRIQQGFGSVDYLLGVDFKASVVKGSLSKVKLE